MTDHLKHADSGHLLHGGNGHLVRACDTVPAPCFCPDNLADSYAINPDLLDACASCEGGICSTIETWDGTFQRNGTCEWRGLNATLDHWTVGQCFELDGKNLSTIHLRLDPYECKWILSIKCFADSGENVVWEGVKTTDQSPSGTYTRSDGCSLPLTLVVY